MASWASKGQWRQIPSYGHFAPKTATRVTSSLLTNSMTKTSTELATDHRSNSYAITAVALNLSLRKSVAPPAPGEAQFYPLQIR